MRSGPEDHGARRSIVKRLKRRYGSPAPPASKLGATCYVIVAAIALVWLPAGHEPDPLLAVTAVCAYVAAMTLELPLGYGEFAGVIQPAFVLMTLSLPLNVTPAAVGLCTVAGSALRDRAVPAARPALWVNSSWYCIAPTVVLALAAPGPASWSRWPVYVAAFGAQFIFETLIDRAFRMPAGWNERESGRLAELVGPVVVDALLTPVGVVAAVIGQDSPGAALSLLAGVFGLLAMLAHERGLRLEHQHRALRDSLTGLANRALFEELAAAAAHRCARKNVCGALLMVDVNDFKSINDRFGHVCGDGVLRAFATRLNDRVRGADSVARLGGDEFAVLLGEPTTVRDAEVVADTLRKAFEVPLDIPDVGALRVSASIGAAQFGRGTTPLQAIADADGAMYAEKRVRLGEAAA